jgi:large subunit ribosomal protein L29
MKDSFKDLSYEELMKKRDELIKKSMDLRFKKVMGHVENPLEKRMIRRKVARLNTIIHEYALGMRKK